ncbi:MAG: hypothetical protein UY31_C0010G0012 [Candidatus Wolfebacteria bacterium GW2011_GWE1_48_7]|nr:MAG: hypothetical protein UX49_C0001G0014 [Candidatus Wolfebacteria bacterium GW2011_GWC2_46_275]KKU42696.1 MAG: hypothetical protein UX58_C0001G0128 [Candidatus Wolfebacteria bacterium GW2011_GWB2_46_69]KKU54569.1 MAG: hypothetical protein UX76_C0001G0028 [Candidatus Wolfebacteria bacterium GW2011_GWC1_47_103]KKU59953.1 MAG: hypothetical protein UX83_C0001G0028 [Candidatus Wolfebacteria bacterium GW2011_GWE2_47_12]KKU66361.1 MAG: hypothetical protein UX90_C0001G0420 [Candidatus Wolfebacteri
MYVLNGQRPSKQFGSNCYEQSRNIRNELTKAGFDQTYYIEDMIVGRHRSILCYTNKRRFIFCPYFMHRELIDVDGIKDTRTIPAYPIVQGVPSTIRVMREGDIITIAKDWPGQERVDRFTFNLTRGISDDLDFNDYIFRALHEEQTTLSIRFLDQKTGTVDHLICVADTNHLNEELYIRTNEGVRIPRSDRAVFNTKLSTLASIISVDANDAIDFLLKARVLHEKFRINKPTRANTPVPFSY